MAGLGALALVGVVAAALGAAAVAVAAGAATLAGTLVLLGASLGAPAAPAAGSVGFALGLLAEVGGLPGLYEQLSALEAGLRLVGAALLEHHPALEALLRAESCRGALETCVLRLDAIADEVLTAVNGLQAALEGSLSADTRFGSQLGERYRRWRADVAELPETIRSLAGLGRRIRGLLRPLGAEGPLRWAR